MARITVEDCIDKFESRFELVLVASNRARKLYSGENPTVDKDNDKNTVIALREIADESIQISTLKNELVEEYQAVTSSDDEELSLEKSDNDNQTSDEINLESVTSDDKSNDQITEAEINETDLDEDTNDLDEDTYKEEKINFDKVDDNNSQNT